ncbi:flavodoxin family protein [Sporomusa malonica]|uniref:Anti-anti-sigma regulatory factor (Antagonist of anti-sigma factor) n=1 Tax=Sporomusa malonica TaxID=112901 RepID=A0A1W2EE07_9FIRM|nr:flavodoxin family protein [Sporomusa malonica]SMD07905.1 Anti-anti-sigma regulatory factor (antagonist of anti-sigma factor) [Sporomusa malonica]
MAVSETVRSLPLPTRIDDQSAIILKSALIKLINDGARKILCDFSATEFISEAGAEELVQVARFLAKIGGELGICQIKPNVKAALQQSYLFKFYSIEESVALVALKSLVSFFDQYEDILDLKVRMENAVAHIEIYLVFDCDQTMRQVQQTIDFICHNLEQEIKNARVLIVPSAQIAKKTVSRPETLATQIVFSSQDNVPQQLAQAIRDTLPGDTPCITVQAASPADDFDLVSVICLVDQATADAEAASFLKELRNQKVALFAIADNYPYSGYAGDCMKNISALLAASNTVIGKFVCRTVDKQLSSEDLMRARNKYFDILQEIER